jgi:tetratricopeptide (TPR) repeat protein
MKTKWLFLTLVVVTTAIGRPGRALAQGDTIHSASGRPLRGQIVEISDTEIRIDVGDSVQSIPVVDIRQVTFAEDPSQLRRARDLVRQGQLENALTTLSQADVSRVERQEVRTDLEYYRLYCQARLALATGGDLPGTEAAMFRFVGGNRKSYHFFEAAETLGDLAMARGDYAMAAKYYGPLRRNAPWPAMQMHGTLLEAKALSAAGNHAEALKNYDVVIGSSLATAEALRQKSLAAAGRAVCQAQMGQATEAIPSLEKIIVESDPQDTELFAQTYNALGACHRLANQPKDAVLAYLHVDLLFYQSPDDHAEALYHLSNLWNQTNKPDRATAARSLLKSRYPSSRWAKQLGVAGGG